MRELRQDVAALSQRIAALNAALTRLSEREARRYLRSIHIGYSTCLAAWTKGDIDATGGMARTLCRLGWGYSDEDTDPDQLREP
jgi:hypothetical protein